MYEGWQGHCCGYGLLGDMLGSTPLQQGGCHPGKYLAGLVLLHQYDQCDWAGPMGGISRLCSLWLPGPVQAQTHLAPVRGCVTKGQQWSLQWEPSTMTLLGRNPGPRGNRLGEPEDPRGWRGGGDGQHPPCGHVSRLHSVCHSLSPSARGCGGPSLSQHLCCCWADSGARGQAALFGVSLCPGTVHSVSASLS